MRTLFGIFVCLLFSVVFNAQEHRKLLRDGNKAYSEGNYDEAEKFYSDSFEEESSYNMAEFNLGNARYKKNNYLDAADSFELQAEKLENKDDKAGAYHNLGNSYLGNYLDTQDLIKAKQNNPDTVQMLMQAAGKYLQKSEEAFKNALRNNPNDDETRFNYAVVKKLLENAQEQNSGGGNNDQQNQDQQQNQEQLNQDRQKNDQQNQNNNDSGSEPEKDDNKEPEKNEEKENQSKNANEPRNMSKKEAEQILEALRNKELNLHEKLNKKKKTAKAIVIEKDW